MEPLKNGEYPITVQKTEQGRSKSGWYWMKLYTDKGWGWAPPSRDCPYKPLPEGTRYDTATVLCGNIVHFGKGYLPSGEGIN